MQTLETGHHSKGQQEYLLTRTIGAQIDALRRIGLKVPSREFTNNIEDGLAETVKSCLDGGTLLRSIPHDEFCDEIITLAGKIRKDMPDAVIVSTAPIITAELPSAIRIEMNRLYDAAGNFIGIGSRPGHAPVDVQLTEVVDQLHNKQVIIVEDGAFTGSSLKFILNKLQKIGVNVDAIVLGILFPEAMKNLRDFHGKVYRCTETENPVDWMPSHDFIPLLPNSGRVIGHVFGESAMPVYLHNTAAMSVPYILPFLRKGKKCSQWTGLTDDYNKVRGLSEYCISSGIAIFEEIERLNGNTLRIVDLIGAYPRSHIPVHLDMNLVAIPCTSHEIVNLLKNEVLDSLRED